MGMRPGVLCKLEKNKLIDSQVGFVDTFNWMVDYIDNLKGDGDLNAAKSITLDKSDTAHPVIKMTGAGGGAVTVVGTDGSSATGSSVQIVGGLDTNLSSSVSLSGDMVVVAIDVYYK